MNDSDQDIERELRQLRPRPASLRLKQSIAADIDRPIVIGNWYAPLAVAASIAIAAGLIGLFARPSHPSHRGATVGTEPVPVVDSSIPTVIAYQRAFAHSDADLAALLDRHAAASHAPSVSQPPSSREAPLRWRDTRMIAPTSHLENPL